MSPEPFDLACDRLSQVVDQALYERLHWERNEAPMLARLVALAHGALEQRSEFELTEEGATPDLKRFVLKVHSNRIMAITIWLDRSQVNVDAAAIERSRYQVQPGPPITADYAVVDEQWMASALEQLFGRVQA
ncbi:MAG: hypothetical protein ABIQ81_02655 [Novosphingobium sp.]